MEKVDNVTEDASKETGRFAKIRPKGPKRMNLGAEWKKEKRKQELNGNPTKVSRPLRRLFRQKRRNGRDGSHGMEPTGFAGLPQRGQEEGPAVRR